MDHKTRAGWATTVFAITLGVLLSIGLGVAYSNLAMNYHYELQDDARPVIQPTAAPGPAGQMQRVLMIVIEGGRFDALSNPAIAPNITSFAATGTQLGNCHAQFPTVTKTAVGTIYTGAAPFTQPYLMNTQTTPAQMPCETLFKVACRQPGGATALCGDPQWAEIFAPYVNASYLDLADFLSQYITAPPLFAAVQLNATDVAGWAHGGNSPEYGAAAQLVDSQVGQVLRALDGHGLLAGTLVVLTSSSGQVDALPDGLGGNGGEEEDVTHTFTCFVGAGVTVGTWDNDSTFLEDIAPTVSFLMGWPVPTNSNGEIINATLNMTAAGAQSVLRDASMAIQLAERSLGLLNATGNVLQVESSPEEIANYMGKLDNLKTNLTAASTDDQYAAVAQSARNLRTAVDELQSIWVGERVFKERFSRYMGIVAVIFFVFIFAVRIVKRNHFVIEKGQIALAFANVGIANGMFWILYGFLSPYFSFSTFSDLLVPPWIPLFTMTAAFLAVVPLAIAITRVAFIKRNGYAPENDFTSMLSIHVMANYLLIIPTVIIYGFKVTYDFPPAWVILPAYVPVIFALFLLLIAPLVFGVKRMWDKIFGRWVKPKFEHIIDARETWHIISRDEQAILEYRRRIVANAVAARELEAQQAAHNNGADIIQPEDNRENAEE